MNIPPAFEIGLKTDPIEYRYSYPWLFKIMQRHGLHYAQLGTFFELYQLPDRWFLDLREQAAAFDISLSSLFTAHRELGGFYRNEPGFSEVAYHNFARLIEIGGLVGASCVGCNPGAVLRDQMEQKKGRIEQNLIALKKLMHHAWRHGVETITFEPMSCLAEPPTLPEEIRYFAETLMEYHENNAETASIGICLDVSHGYANAEGVSIISPAKMLEASIPWLAELHLKNTDSVYGSTFGFGDAERLHGIVDLTQVRNICLEHAHRIPRNSLVAYFETSGPKLGRDYSDCTLEADLDASLNFITSVFHGSSEEKKGQPRAIEISSKKCMRPDSVSLPHPGKSVFISASLMCANLCRLEMEVRTLELSGTDYLHLDIMDAVFTPNMPLGFETIRQLREITALPLDAHLMVHNNDFFVQRMADLGVDLVSVHVESSIHLERTLTLIQSLGMKSGVALNPATPLHALEYVLDRVDFILIMMVNPGFAGQPLIPFALKKIADCRRFLEERGLSVPIQVDGNVSFKNIPLMVESGTDILVAGSSSAFHPQGAILDNMKHMHDLASTGLNNRPCLIKNDKYRIAEGYDA